MKKPVLVIMAAGMGSRYGGLKQIDPIDATGHIIMDFSIFDAKRAGFEKVVFIIKKENEADFKEAIGNRIGKYIQVEYAYQDLHNIPEGFEVPEGRVKPWGTGHAVLCAAEKITSPFAVINADDFYGQTSYQLIHDWLVANEGMCMVGYQLGNTLTENGTVSRGVCEVERGKLVSVTEHTALDKNCGIPLDTIVSMNMWGLDTGVFPYLQKAFEQFLSGRINEPKSEFYLPSAVSKRIAAENMTVSVLETAEKWYGVTYREDMPSVREAMARFIDGGLYR